VSVQLALDDKLHRPVRASIGAKVREILAGPCSEQLAHRSATYFTDRDIPAVVERLEQATRHGGFVVVEGDRA